MRVYNNLLWGNTNRWSGYGMVSARDGTSFVNNIVADNDGIGISAESGASVEYNDAHGNSGGDLYVANGSASATNLQSSPCVNAGDPLAGYNDPDGTRNDMGAFGGPGGAWTP